MSPHPPLWLAVAFPGLGLALHTRSQPRGEPRPLALVQDGRVLACNVEAEDSGVAPGQRTASALALCPSLRFLEHRPVEEARLLRQLAEACIAVTPTVVLCPPQGLLLEVGGCLRLFRGQAGLRKALRRALKPFALPAVLAQAPTPKAALALVKSAQAAASLQVMTAADAASETAHQKKSAPLAGRPAAAFAEAAEQSARSTREPHGTATNRRRAHAPTQASFAELGDAAPSPALRDYLPLLRAVPVTALPWDEALQKKLAALHLHTLGDLFDLPRAALSKRLGVAATRYLAQLEGALPDPQVAITVAEEFEATLFFLDGVSQVEGLRFPMKRLLDDFCRFLRQRQLSCLRFSWRLAHQDKSRQQIFIGSSRGEPQAARFMQLTELKLEHVVLSAPVEALTLQAREFQPQSDTRLALLPEPGEEDGKALELLDRLRARLGAEACQQIVPGNALRPEAEQRLGIPSAEKKAAPRLGTERRTEPAPPRRGVGTPSGREAETLSAPARSRAVPQATHVMRPQEVPASGGTRSGTVSNLPPGDAPVDRHHATAPHEATLMTDGHPGPALFPETPLRPFWLWPQPQPVRVMDGQLWWQGAFTLLSRPERIALPWWEDGDTRDYYLARHDNGVHYWIYFSREQQAWFCHGVFG